MTKELAAALASAETEIDLNKDDPSYKDAMKAFRKLKGFDERVGISAMGIVCSDSGEKLLWLGICVIIHRDFVEDISPLDVAITVCKWLGIREIHFDEYFQCPIADYSETIRFIFRNWD